MRYINLLGTHAHTRWTTNTVLVNMHVIPGLSPPKATAFTAA